MPAIASASCCRGDLSRLFTVSWDLGVLKHEVDIHGQWGESANGDSVMAMADSSIHAQMSSGFSVWCMIQSVHV